MGCVASKLDINDVHPNMFAVNNVDDMGVKLNSGQLEITEVELVLHRRGKQPVKWPLRYLKRYGFEEGLFSFEAGRKNPTGAGIYSFKCRRAENLFNLLQVRVRNQVSNSEPISVLRDQAGTQDLVQANSTPTEDTAPLSTLPTPRTSVTEAPLVDPSTEDGCPAYTNITCPTPGLSPPPRVPPLHPGTMESLSLSPRQQVVGEVEEEEPAPGHAYENVGSLNSPSCYVPPRDMFTLPPKPMFRPKLPSTNSNTSDLDSFINDATTSPPESPGIVETSINYIVLDLDNPAPSPSAKVVSPTFKVEGVSAAPPATKAGLGYVTIDFDKTDALIKSANQRFFEEDDPGVRKTRHNSSLSDLAVTTKP